MGGRCLVLGGGVGVWGGIPAGTEAGHPLGPDTTPLDQTPPGTTPPRPDTPRSDTPRQDTPRPDTPRTKYTPHRTKYTPSGLSTPLGLSTPSQGGKYTSSSAEQCCEIWSMCGRYASYWNAILFNFMKFFGRHQQNHICWYTPLTKNPCLSDHAIPCNVMHSSDFLSECSTY